MGEHAMPDENGASVPPSRARHPRAGTAPKPRVRTATKAPADKTAAPAAKKTTAAQRDGATKPPARKASAPKKPPAKKASAKKASVPRKAPAKKTTAAKVAAPKRAPAPKTTAANAGATQTGRAKTAPTKKSVGKRTAVGQTAANVALPRVPDGDETWTAGELEEVRGQLEADRGALTDEYDAVLAELDMLRDQAADSVGDDPADSGAKAFEREQELSMVYRKKDILQQTEYALARISDGSYGRCESCREPIAKARLQAFPSAVLCVRCKQREERR